MELFPKELEQQGILVPAQAEAPGIDALLSLCVYEEGEAFLNTLPKRALVFVPAGSTPGKRALEALAAAGCALVCHEGREPSLPGGLPLYFLPPGQTISGALERCYILAGGGAQRLVEVSLDAMEKLSDNFLHHKYKDSNMIQVIRDLLKCPVVFTTSDFHLQRMKSVPTEHIVVNPLYTEDSFDWDKALEGFDIRSSEYRPGFASGIEGQGIGGYLFSSAYCKERGCRIAVFPIDDPNKSYGYIFLALDKGVDALPPEMGVKLQQVLASLRFEVIKSDEIAHTINRYYDFLLDELIESDRTDFRKLMQKYGLVQKPIADEYDVLVVGRKAHTMEDVLFHELLTSQQFNLMYDRIAAQLGTINFFIFERKDSIILLLPPQLFEDVREGITALTELFRDILKDQYEGAGTSDRVPTEQVRQGYFQALKALAISQRAPGYTPYFYADLGILRFFFDRSGEMDMRPLLSAHRQYIQPILDYDSSRGGELYPTLTTYIACCSSPSAACRALYIHKNTLYSRLSKISQLLGLNLSDSESIFNLSLGIRIHTLMEAGILQAEVDDEG